MAHRKERDRGGKLGIENPQDRIKPKVLTRNTGWRIGWSFGAVQNPIAVPEHTPKRQQRLLVNSRIYSLGGVGVPGSPKTPGLYSGRCKRMSRVLTKGFWRWVTCVR